MKFRKRTQYKACPPEETIQRIKQILSDHDVPVTERMLPHEKYNTYSCQIGIADPELKDARLSTNGKGMTPEYALASGYGEFMERLCAGALFNTSFLMNAYRRGDTDYCIAKDEQYLNAREVLDACGPLAAAYGQWDEAELAEYAESLDPALTTPCISFTDIETGQSVLLPWCLIQFGSTSNGMCAGNNYYEAAAQGLSELYERHAISTAYFRDPVIRTLDPEWFSENEIYTRLENLKTFGFSYRVLDLSMGMDLPVLGLLLRFGNDRICIHSFDAGADSCPVTALERCLTESFQGSIGAILARFSENTRGSYAQACAGNTREEYFKNYYNQLISASAELPDNIAFPDSEYATSYICQPDPDPEANYNHLQSIARRQNWHLLVRDWSWMDFPVYQVWIPEISNIFYPIGMPLSEFGFCFGPHEETDIPCYEAQVRLLNRLRKQP